MKWHDGTCENPNLVEKRTREIRITIRDGQARLEITIKYGIVETPCLLPVINPNIRTIEPREMWTSMAFRL